MALRGRDRLPLPREMNLLLLLPGFCVGLLIGLTSMGGAALMTPFLILLLGMKPAIAVGTDLVYSAATKLVGAWVHWQRGTVDIPLAWRLASGSIPGSLIGVWTIVHLRQRGADVDHYIRTGLGIVLVIVAVVIALRSLCVHSVERSRFESASLKRWAAIPWGLLVGFAVGFTSVGSGSLMIPYLMLLYPLSSAKAVGTDVFHGAALVAFTALLHSSIGDVNWQVAAILLIGSIPGVLVGSCLAAKLPNRAVGLAVSFVLLATGAKMV